MSAEVEVDEFGEKCLQILQAQGVPNVVSTVMVSILAISVWVVG